MLYSVERIGVRVQDPKTETTKVIMTRRYLDRRINTRTLHY